jgi:hypothetical protein
MTGKRIGGRTLADRVRQIDEKVKISVSQPQTAESTPRSRDKRFTI